MSIEPPQDLPQNLSRPIADLESRIGSLAFEDRLELRDDLQRLCARLEREGYAVPDRLRALAAALDEAAGEGQFDNLPV